MGKHILDGFSDLSLFDKLKKLQQNLQESDRLVESIEGHTDRDDETIYFVKRFVEMYHLLRSCDHIGRFLKYPLHEVRPGRPKQYPDSASERAKYRLYREQGWSIRDIAREEKVSPDTVFRKLKRYMLD